MNPDSVRYTSFVVPFGQYEYTRMPFGLNTAAQCFQRGMVKLLGDLDDVFIYLDDVLIVSKTTEAHYETTKNILNRLKEHNIKVNWKKSEFNQKQISYLGFIIQANKIKADLSKLNLTKLEVLPTTKKGLRSLIGFANWFRNFILRISNLLAPFNEKLKVEKID